MEIDQARDVNEWRCEVELSHAGKCRVDVGGLDQIDAGDNAIRRLIENRDLDINCRPRSWSENRSVQMMRQKL